jgi:hypothetical protein
MWYFSLPYYLIPLKPKYLPQHPIPKHPQPMFLPQYEKSSLTPIPNNKKNYISVYLGNKVVVQFPVFTQISVDNLIFS